MKASLMDTVVYCVRRGVYDALEYGRSYPKVGEEGEHLRIRLPDGRVRKFPAESFSLQCPHRLTRWKLDNPIEDSACDWIEVSFEIAGSVRWVAFVTPAFLAEQLPQSGEPCWVQENLVIVPEVTREVIRQCLQYLLEQGDLLKQSRELGPSKCFEGPDSEGWVASWEDWV